MRTWTLAFALGCWLGTFVPALPPLNTGWLLVPGLCLLLWRRTRLLSAGLCGFLWCLSFLQHFEAGLLPVEWEGHDLLAEGRVHGLPQQYGNRQRLLFEVERACLATGTSGNCGDDRIGWRGRAQVNLYDTIDLIPGERLTLVLRLKRPHGFANPHTFDYEAWLWQQGIEATGYIRTVFSGDGMSGIAGHGMTDRLRMHLLGSLETELGKVPGGTFQLPLIQALTLGNRYGISDRDWTLFSETGTTHLMVISGLHIGLITWLCFRLAVFAWSRSITLMTCLAAPRAAALFSITGALVYCSLAGFSLPATRALIMVVVILAGQLCLIPARATHSLFTALLLILLLDPLASMSAGFWLSFVSVGLLLYLRGGNTQPDAKTGEDLLKQLEPASTPGSFSRLRDYLRSALHTQWLLLAGLLPLMLVFTGQTSLLAPLVNLLAVPLVGLVVVPLCLTGLALLQFWTGGAIFCLLLADWLLEGLYRGLASVSGIVPGAVLHFSSPSALQLVLLCVAAACLLLPALRRFRVLALPCLLSLLLPRPVPEQSTARFHVLDVGQGLAVLVQTRNHLVVYDTGPAFSERFNAGSGLLMPYIQGAGLELPYRIIISHGDGDHAGGLDGLLQALGNRAEITDIVSGQPERLGRQVRARRCEEERWFLDGVHFMLFPVPGPSESANDRSCILRVSVGDHHVLLPGDIERSAERRLLDTYADSLKADVLLVPHHGSATSSSPAFLNRVMPRFAIVSSGYLNRYHHPAPAVVDRYLNRNAEVFDTSSTGALLFELSEAGATWPEAFRTQHKRVWR